MPSNEDITYQQGLLNAYRRNLVHLLRQALQYGGEADAPLHVANQLRTQREQIQRIKIVLRGWGVVVDDHPDDETPDSPAPIAVGEAPTRHVGPAEANNANKQAPPGPIRNRWAVLVGVNHYVDPGIADLNFCVNDVVALAQTLDELGYTVVVLHDGAEEYRRPTHENIEIEIDRLRPLVQPDDLLWVHFAGHGKLENGKPLLLPRDARLPAYRNALPLADFERQLRDLGARRLVLTLDACHTGVELGRDVADAAFIRNAYELAEGFALIAASTSQQRAQEWREKRHGVFTYYLLEALQSPTARGDKRFVTVGDLALQVCDRLRKWNVRQGGLIQEPTYRVEGIGDMIVADYGAGAAAPRPAFAPNPFRSAGKVTDPATFVGRERLLGEIFHELGRGCNLSLIGDAQIGKSSLLAMICAQGPQRLGLPQDAFISLDMQLIDSEHDLFDELCSCLGIPVCRGLELQRALRGKRIILCIDEIERMADAAAFSGRERAQLRGLADGENAPLTLVIASRVPLDELFPDARGKTSPLANICTPIDVPAFTPAEARRFLELRLQGTGVQFNASQTDELLAQSGRHPNRLRLAAAALYRRLSEPAP